jgi:hypothetical protein
MPVISTLARAGAAAPEATATNNTGKAQRRIAAGKQIGTGFGKPGSG